MKVVRCFGLWLVVAIAGLAGATAHDPKPATVASPPPATAAASEGPAAAVESFHAALSNADREGVLSWLDPEVIIFESGGAEMSRDEYASHHLESDMAFVGATKTDVLDRQEQSEGELAWVLTRSHTTGTFRDRPVDIDGVETIVLRRREGRWRIVHIHWSSQARKDQ